MNIFNIISSATERIERFHSEFLMESLTEDKEFRNLFIERIFLKALKKDLKKGFIESSNSNKLDIKKEDVFHDRKRIDLVIEDKENKRIIGIEVKTTDSSVTDGQLVNYYEGMKRKYAGYEVYIVYLTPHSEGNVPKDLVERISAIKEFDSYKKDHSDSVHINWGEVVSLYPIESSNYVLYSQHKRYINKNIVDVPSLYTLERNRGFAEFIGEDTFKDFLRHLREEDISLEEAESKLTVHLAENTSKYTEIIQAARILMESKKLNKKDTGCRNNVEQSVKDKYEKTGLHNEFFKELFLTVEDYPYLWLEGKGRIGIRAAHSDHGGTGVSLLTISPDSIEIRLER